MSNILLKSSRAGKKLWTSVAETGRNGARDSGTAGQQDTGRNGAMDSGTARQQDTGRSPSLRPCQEQRYHFIAVMMD